MKLNHVMIDLETMNTTHKSPIVSVGAVVFDPRYNMVDKQRTFYAELDWENQGRSVCPDTVLWWSKQSAKARSALHGFDDLDDTLKDLSNWLCKDCKVWGNGSTFDITILEDAYYQEDIKIPWKFWNVRDCRTIKDLYESSRGGWDKKSGGDKHNALHDAIYQAEYICTMWNKILNK